VHTIHPNFLQTNSDLLSSCHDEVQMLVSSLVSCPYTLYVSVSTTSSNFQPSYHNKKMSAKFAHKRIIELVAIKKLF
jgi:hypothetical protein